MCKYASGFGFTESPLDTRHGIRVLQRRDPALGSDQQGHGRLLCADSSLRILPQTPRTKDLLLLRFQLAERGGKLPKVTQLQSGHAGI